MNQTPNFLQAGPIRVCYETGFLRYVSLGDTEILRIIYFAIRDHNWLTASITLSDQVIDKTADSFSITYTWHVNDLGIRMEGKVAIRGDAEGTISVDFYGRALNAFQKNRIGLCVLHPLDGVLGQPAQLVAPDGRITNSHFPVFISPHQPFLSIESMRWKPASGAVWQLDFSGDVFETEDQRNWTDTSFKTYSTPASQPFPVAVSAGDEFHQQVRFSRSTQTIADDVIPEDEQMFTRVNQILSETQPTHPRIGVGQRTAGPPLTNEEADLLRTLRLSHLRVDVFFNLPNWQTLLTNAIADATLLSVPLELAAFFGNDPITELRTLQHFLQDQSASVYSIILYQAATLTTSTELLQTLVPLVREGWPATAIGGGTDDNFVELNRNRFAMELVDFLVYSVNPQVHASDDLTLLENIAGQAETVVTARQFSDGKPIHISPVTLRPRYITLTGTAIERLNAPADPRQFTDFGADWTRQSLSALANAGVASITYYQSHGPTGLVDGNMMSPAFTVLEAFQREHDNP
ncbi:hypothetical protein [Spirosoma agri]|uniref:Uncharacterized protein n=1 Tax=Spirosoma agri TaxID=1987381 RepID=A0A6M0IEA4_9BACT|nr:hypothetical protein [Spirosoma agri]NEU66095.1 hypothetical protein [Spirosoma agri]